jgi:hypothetical protein
MISPGFCGAGEGGIAAESLETEFLSFKKRKAFSTC